MAAYRQVLNPHYSNAQHTAIDCTVFIEALGERVPFTARPDDPEPMGREIFAKAVAGNFGPLGPTVAAPVATPTVISDRQFFQALALQGRITQAEALAAVKTGTIPATLASMISTLTGAEAFNAEMLLSGATQFERNHPLTATIGAAQGMDAAHIDDFFRFAGSL